MSEDFNYEDPPVDPLEMLKQEAYREGYEAALGDIRSRLMYEIGRYIETRTITIYELSDDIEQMICDAETDLKKMVNS